MLAIYLSLLPYIYLYIHIYSHFNGISSQLSLILNPKSQANSFMSQLVLRFLKRITIDIFSYLFWTNLSQIFPKQQTDNLHKTRKGPNPTAEQTTRPSSFIINIMIIIIISSISIHYEQLTTASRWAFLLKPAKNMKNKLSRAQKATARNKT